MILHTPTEKLFDWQLAEQEVSIEALAHLIDADFDSEKSCHAVCMLLAQLYADSDNRINRKVADLATKALNSTVTVQMEAVQQ